MSRSVKEMAFKIAKEKAELQYELSREPKISEIAARVGISAEEVAEVQNAVQPPVSLTEVNEDGDRQTDVPVVFEQYDNDNRVLLDTAISKLQEKERAIIRLRYFEALTQQETAKRLDMTQVAVSRAEKRILLKLRTIIGSVA